MKTMIRILVAATLVVATIVAQAAPQMSGTSTPVPPTATATATAVPIVPVSGKWGGAGLFDINMEPADVLLLLDFMVSEDHSEIEKVNWFYLTGQEGKLPISYLHETSFLSEAPDSVRIVNNQFTYNFEVRVGFGFPQTSIDAVLKGTFESATQVSGTFAFNTGAVLFRGNRFEPRIDARRVDLRWSGQPESELLTPTATARPKATVTPGS
jgi:hypothetical protein